MITWTIKINENKYTTALSLTREKLKIKQKMIKPWQQIKSIF